MHNTKSGEEVGIKFCGFAVMQLCSFAVLRFCSYAVLRFSGFAVIMRFNPTGSPLGRGRGGFIVLRERILQEKGLTTELHGVNHGVTLF